MLTEEMARKEIETGLSAVCAWCERYWEAKARANGRAHACDVADCGGPSAGRAFPKYKGPRANKASYCLFCGVPADMAVEFRGVGGGMLGCCAAHEKLLKRILSQRPGKPLVVSERIVPVIAAAEGSAD